MSIITETRLNELANQKINNIQLLSEAELRAFAPAIFNEERDYGRTSEKFVTIRLWQLINEIMDIDPNWGVRLAIQETSKMSGEKSKVLVRMTNPNLSDGERSPELVLMNAANGTFRFQAGMGYLEGWCWNGMMAISEQIVKMKFFHRNGERIRDKIQHLLDTFKTASEELYKKLGKMKDVELTSDQRLQLAESAIVHFRGNNSQLMNHLGIKTERSKQVGGYVVVEKNKEKLTERIDFLTQLLTPQNELLLQKQGTTSVFDTLQTIQRNTLEGGVTINYKAQQKVKEEEEYMTVTRKLTSTLVNENKALKRLQQVIDGKHEFLLMPHAPTQIRNNQTFNQFIYNQVSELIPELV